MPLPLGHVMCRLWKSRGLTRVFLGGYGLWVLSGAVGGWRDLTEPGRTTHVLVPLVREARESLSLFGHAYRSWLRPHGGMAFFKGEVELAFETRRTCRGVLRLILECADLGEDPFLRVEEARRRYQVEAGPLSWRFLLELPVGPGRTRFRFQPGRRQGRIRLLLPQGGYYREGGGGLTHRYLLPQIGGSEGARVFLGPGWLHSSGDPGGPQAPRFLSGRRAFLGLEVEEAGTYRLLLPLKKLWGGYPDPAFLLDGRALSLASGLGEGPTLVSLDLELRGIHLCEIRLRGPIRSPTRFKKSVDMRFMAYALERAGLRLEKRD